MAQKAFDHSAFDALLKAHVSNGLVDYAAFEKSSEFQAYLDKLAAFDPSSLPKSEALAFWINAYNAYTIRLINKHDEKESIRNINKTLGLISAYGPWKEKLANVCGKSYGLDEIEQGIIRPRLQRASHSLRAGVRGDGLPTAAKRGLHWCQTRRTVE